MQFGAKYCDSLLITASGSTFGWWIGYLMDESKQKDIYYNWLATKNAGDCRDKHDFDTFPPEWKRLRMTKSGKEIVYEKRWHKDIKKAEGDKTYKAWTRIT